MPDAGSFGDVVTDDGDDDSDDMVTSESGSTTGLQEISRTIKNNLIGFANDCKVGLEMTMRVWWTERWRVGWGGE